MPADHRMSPAVRGLVAWGLLALPVLLGGCPQSFVQPPHVGSAVAAVSVHELARSLGLRVSHSTAYSALLEDQANRLLVFGPPRPSVVLNGRPVCDGQGVTVSAGQLVVPSSVVQLVRPQLVRALVVTSDHSPTHHRPSVPPSPTARLTVVIDPGHGGKDPGALNRSNRNGPHEKDINLDTALRLEKLLTARGVNVILTRTDDSFLELEERAAIANRNRADLFVSVHADSAANRSAEGFSVYIARAASAQSVKYGQDIVRCLEGAGVPSRGLKRADYRVLVQTDCPAVLVELGFMSHGEELARLSSGNYRQRLADAIAGGIQQYAQASR